MTTTSSAPDAGRRAPHGVTLAGVEQRFRGNDGSETFALGPLDLQIEDGELVTVLGPSGCGKSTLLRLVAGFEPPTAGTVTARGEPVVGPRPDRGVVFQQPNLYPWLDVAGNIAFGLKMTGVPRRDRARIVADHVSLVGLDGFAGHRPYELSGGMQQRAQIARVLATDPSIVLMDEPFAALDALTRDRLQDELRKIWRTRRKTIVFITHNVEEAVYLGTRVIVLSGRPGTVVADVPVPFSHEDIDGRDLRDSPDFAALRHRLSGYLSDGERRHDGPADHRDAPGPRAEGGADT